MKANPTFGRCNIHKQAGLLLPPGQFVLQHQSQDLLDLINQNRMKINTKKTNVIPFNFSKNFDFLPQVKFPGHESLEGIYTTKLHRS